MNAISLLRNQIQDAHELMEGTMADVTLEQAHWTPPGVAVPLGAAYAHAVVREDWVINGLLSRGAPLFVAALSGKTGISDPQMRLTAEWAHALRLELATAREYAVAVYAATDAYMTTMPEGELERLVDLSSEGLGKMTVGWILSNWVIGHSHNLVGEISCLKGLQGLRGYPF